VQSLLIAAGKGDPAAAEQLLPLVYEHLRELARAKLASEPAGQTIQPTALVHEAYLRLVRNDQPWNDRKHFFAAAALAMRRILVDRARAKRGSKRGGKVQKFSLEQWDQPADPSRTPDGREGPAHSDAMDWLALEDAMNALDAQDSELAQVVHLRYFAGLTLEETALALGKSARTINRDWMVARAWLLRHMREHPKEQ
jgi:RNA polymerase sigma factor (TIGR02999 family)